jgi:Protein of unknown function (DUF1566)
MTLHRLLAHSFAACASFALLTLASLAHAEPGMLRITTSPGDAQIFVNGQRKGNSPSQEGQTFALRLPQGDYTVEARKSDSKDYYGKKSVYVANDSLQTVDISLSEVKLPAKPYGQAPNGSAKLGGLEWLRCSLGQAWSGSSCIGDAKEYSFDEAKTAAVTFNAAGYGGKRDWRVPTLRELQGLRVCSTGFDSKTQDFQDGSEAVSERCKDNASEPTIDTASFPQTPINGRFWSSSLNMGNAPKAWNVNFVNGHVYDGWGRGYPGYVRLVRVSQ